VNPVDDDGDNEAC